MLVTLTSGPPEVLRLPSVLATALLLTVAACADVTQIVVVVDSELAVPEEMDHIGLVVTRQRDGVVVARSELALPASAMPLTFSLQQNGGDPGPLSMQAQVRARGQVVLTRHVADVLFVEGRIMMLRMDVLRRCLIPATCPPVGPLTAWAGTPKPWAAGDALAQDGSSAFDAKLNADASVLDSADEASVCGLDCDVSCEGGDQCGSVCPSAGDCSLACSDEGTVCDLQSLEAKASSLTCKKHARCAAAVKGKGNVGRAVCEDGAWCDFFCESPTCHLDCRSANCRMRTAGAAALARIVCGRGADCALEFLAGNDVEVVCNGATCGIVCGAAARCDVKCLGGAVCLLACSDDAACALSNCPSPLRRSCGNGVFVCGRDCP